MDKNFDTFTSWLIKECARRRKRWFAKVICKRREVLHDCREVKLMATTKTMMRLIIRCAKRISTFLRSLRDLSNAGVP